MAAGWRRQPTSTFKGRASPFFLTNGGYAIIGSHATLQLSAPTFLVFGSRSATGVSNSISGGSASTLQGAIYLPASSIQFSGNSTASGGCTQIIAQQINLIGNSTLSSCESAGSWNSVI
jgi:hypothetical protein